MDCCKSKKQRDYSTRHQSLLPICALIFAVIMVLIFILKMSSWSTLALAMFFICPLMHILMMRGHNRRH